MKSANGFKGSSAGPSCCPVRTHPTLKVEFFGPFRVWRNGESHPVLSSQTHKCKALLKLLLLERGRIWSKDALIDLLWPSHEPGKAGLNLKVRVSELRRILEPTLGQPRNSSYILTVGEGYYFNREVSCTIDAESFLDYYRQATRWAEQHQWKRAIPLFEDAVGLYKSDFLAEDRYEDWAIPYRERWRELYLHAISQLADCHAGLGSYEQASLWCRQALCADSLREQTYRKLLLYQGELGNWGEVHRIYEQCRTVILDNFGRKPSIATQELYEQMLSGADLNQAPVNGHRRKMASSTMSSRKTTQQYAHPINMEDHEVLKSWQQSHDRRSWQRARIILLHAQGESVKGIARQVDLSSRRVRDWIHRFEEGGLASLKLKKSTGRPRRISDVQRDQIVQLMKRPPATYGSPLKRWTQEEVARVAVKRGIVSQISRTTVQLIVAQARGRWAS